MGYRLHSLACYDEHGALAPVIADTVIVPIESGRDKLICRWTNTSGKTLCCQMELCIQSGFPFTHYLIPGVSYNGNHWGKGKEPKGLLYKGQPWVFDYRRTTIPACTISENAENYLALIASCEDPQSLAASCSMEPQPDGTMVHRILYPEIERPLTYCTRDGYTESHEGFIFLSSGESITTTVFILTGKPVLPNFAAANVQDAALDLLPKDFLPRYTPDKVEELACLFAQQLLQDVGERRLFSIGQLPDAQGEFQNRIGNEFGWCGQNGLYARLMLQRGIETSDQKLIEIGVGVLDAFSHEAIGKTGLIHTHYDWMLSGKSDVEDTCNLGFAICELTKAWQVMHEHGEDHAAWLAAAKGTASFLITHWSDAHGFGKAWNVETGECTDQQGTIGAYVIPGLTMLYRATGETRYLDAARKACRFYRDRDLAVFQCCAGALDTYCIDKESSGPLLIGSLELYEIDSAQEWLDCAKMAGWYFCSWMFHHDTLNRSGSDFERYGYHTLGGTSVSAQHHHIDPWGALVVPQMLRLWQLTGDKHWKKRGKLMWANAIQNMAPLQGNTIHGQHRSPGAQNEGYHHCHWGDEGAPGLINVWLVAWPQAFCWQAAHHMHHSLFLLNTDTTHQ